MHEGSDHCYYDYGDTNPFSAFPRICGGTLAFLPSAAKEVTLSEGAVNKRGFSAIRKHHRAGKASELMQGSTQIGEKRTGTVQSMSVVAVLGFSGVCRFGL